MMLIVCDLSMKALDAFIHFELAYPVKKLNVFAQRKVIQLKYFYDKCNLLQIIGGFRAEVEKSVN